MNYHIKGIEDDMLVFLHQIICKENTLLIEHAIGLAQIEGYDEEKVRFALHVLMENEMIVPFKDGGILRYGGKETDFKATLKFQNLLND